MHPGDGCIYLGFIQEVHPSELTVDAPPPPLKICTPQKTDGQQAGGTYPTGMHTCYLLITKHCLYFLSKRRYKVLAECYRNVMVAGLSLATESLVTDQSILFGWKFLKPMTHWRRTVPVFELILFLSL